MIVTHRAAAGTLESSDIFLEVLPRERGIEIELSSTVINQYGDEIRSAIQDVLDRLGVENVLVRASDRGALECVIRARTETAVLRAGGEAAK
jgi:citrate lyase subunit gamma (acyl carrier protein)